MRTFERLGPRAGWSRPITFFVLLLGVAVVVGCGAGDGATATGRLAGTPSVLASAVNRAQAVIDDRSASPRSLKEAGRTEQLAFGELARRRRLRRATLAQLSSPARSAATASLRAADALAQLVRPQRHFPRWRIVAPPRPGMLLGYFEHAAARYRLAWQYLAAIELVETRMGRIHGLSPAGAQGPMQFMPATWAEYGRGSIDSQHDSIMAAARFLAANGGRKHIARALLHYNPSHSYVVAVQSYAREMQRDPRAFYGYYYWQVFYRTTKGTFILPAGYPRVRPKRLSG